MKGQGFGGRFVIEINDISAQYRSGDTEIPALSSLSLAIEDEEYLSILGPNGSGKSTLLKAMCGLVPLSSGEIRIDGEKINRGDFSTKLFGKVGVVFQEPSGQFLMPTVIKEIESPLQNLGLDYSRQQQRFNNIVRRFELENILYKSPENLSPGQMQIVNLTVAFSIGQRVMLLDEPTTFLDLKYRKLFLEYIAEINLEGTAIIHITQYPDEALLARRTAIIDKGRIVVEGDPGSVLSNEENITGSRLSLPRKIEFKKHFGFDMDDDAKATEFVDSVDKPDIKFPQAATNIKAVISARDLNYSYADNDFRLEIGRLDLYENQIAGLVGPSGSGKSTLALLLSGAVKPRQGIVEYYGKNVSDFGEYRKNIGLSWQMPDPVLIGPTVADDLRLGNNEGEKIEVGSLLKEVGLAGFENRIVDTLSGGEKRKLSLASVLGPEPEYLILDEPAAFLDPVSQAALKTIIKKILSNLEGALIISHDLSFLSDLADRIIGLKNGRIAFDLPAYKFFSYPEYSRAIDLEIDEMISFRDKLTQAGVVIPSNSLDPGTLKELLENS